MNNTIRGLIRPGVYNANISLFTKTYDINQPNIQGVYLKIAKDTMFVFSNSYVASGGKYYRDLNEIGDYVVKCIADEDLEIQLAQPGGEFTWIFDSNDSQTGSLTPVLYVYAQFKYDPEGTGSEAPEFKLAIPRTTNEYTTEQLSTYYLPNEGLSTIVDTISYLVVGVLLDNQHTSTGTTPYRDGNDWRATGFNGVHGSQIWIENHVFTARGLLEYRSAISKNYGGDLTSIAFAPSYNRIYLTPGQYYFNSILYEMSGKTIDQLTGQNTEAEGTAPTVFGGWIVDHTLAAEGATSWTKYVPDLTGLDGKIIVDFLFLALQTEYSEATTPINLSGLFTATDVEQRLIPYRLVCDKPAGWSATIFDSQLALSSALGFASQTKIVPLDISLANIARLKGLIVNKNLLMPIVDKMRRDEELAPFLLPNSGQSLVPILIAFREVDGTDFIDVQSSITTNSALDVTGTGPAPAVNPVNVLSYFELQASSFAVLGTNLAVQEVYTTLPFLD